METKKVSVIVPVHNAGKYLSKCLNSIVNQSYENLQIVLVDDGSKDKSPLICDRLTEKDSRVKVIHRPLCGGVSRARNIGIENSDGDYICFVDSDDYIEEKYIQTLVRCIEEHKVNIVFGQNKYLFGKKTKKRITRISKGIYRFDDISDRLIDDGTITGILFGSVWGAIYDAVFIHINNLSFNEKLKRNEDGIFNLEALKKSDKIYVTDYDGYIYRQWKETQTIPAFKPDKELVKASESIQRECSDYSEFDVQMKRREISVIFWNSITVARCKGGLIRNSGKLKKYIIMSRINECFPYIDFEKTSFYKRFLIRLLYRKHIFLFSMLMKYVFPFMNRFR